LYSAELQHCAANHDVGCGENVLTKAHKAGTYRISGTRWVIDQLKITDPPAARAVFESVLQAFPANTADFDDVKVLLDSAQAVAKIDLALAKRAARAIEAAVQNPQFEARTQEIVSARFLVDGMPVDTASTRETVLVQTQSLLKRGSFPHLIEMQFANGHPVLLDFWATWCAPCSQEMPQLDALDKKGLTVLAITDENDQVVRKFAAANRYTLPILLDSQGEVFKIYGIVPRPTNILIDGSGRITDRWIGLPESGVLQAALDHARAVHSH